MPDFPIWIPGIPKPQGSKSINRHTGVMYEANPATREWRASCGDRMTDHHHLIGPDYRRSVSSGRKGWHRVRLEFADQEHGF